MDAVTSLSLLVVVGIVVIAILVYLAFSGRSDNDDSI